MTTNFLSEPRTSYSGSHSPVLSAEKLALRANFIAEAEHSGLSPEHYHGLLLDQYLENIHSQPTFNPSLDSL